MLGVDVAQIEVLEELPKVVDEDIYTEWDADDEDDTPQVIDVSTDKID